MPKRRFQRAAEDPFGRIREKAREQLREKLTLLVPPGSIDAAAEGIGIDRSTIYKWRSGLQQPGAVDLAILANYLSVTLSDLVGDKPLPRKMTPYDTNPRIRAVIDLLVDAPAEEQKRILELAEWMLNLIRGGSSSAAPITTSEELPPNVARLERTLPEKTAEFPVEPSDFNEVGDTDYPRRLHGWEQEEWAGTGVIDNDMATWLNKKETRSSKFMTVLVRNSRVSPYQKGWKLLVDVTRQNPSLIKDGEVAVAYRDDVGSFVGTLRHEPGGSFLETDDGERVNLSDGFHLLGPVEDAQMPKVMKPRKRKGGIA